MTDRLMETALALSAFPVSLVVKATVVIVLALLAVRVGRRAPASTRHLILSCAFTVLLLLPVAEMSMPSIAIAIEDGRAAAPVVLPIAIADPVVATVPLPAPAAAHVNPAAAGPYAPSMAALLLTVWMSGVLVALVPVLLTPIRLHRLRRAARRWDGGDAAMAILAGGRRRVAVFVHDDIPAPLTCGIARAVIVLPAEASHWSAGEIERALVHELEHIRRADWPLHLAARVICALYWFHPLVWVAWRRLELEAERACDDAVLRVAERTAYAQQLVTLARRQVMRSLLPTLSMASRSHLSVRVAAVLDGAQARGRIGRRRAALVIAAAALLAAAVAPLRAVQDEPAARNTTAGVPAFEVVSIRENQSGNPGQSMRRQPGGRITATNYAVRGLILNAYGLQPQQLIGGPNWIDSARYDIIAQAPGELAVTEPGTVGPAQVMMQRMLADRFQLAVHTETRELPIYALTVARGDGKPGPRIRPAATDCQALMSDLLRGARGGGALPEPPQRPDGAPACGMRFGPANRLSAGGTSMAALARMLSNPVGRIVEDRTGLAGAFDFDLEFTVDPGAPSQVPGAPPAPQNADAPSIFTALEEQLGLKLEAQRAPVEVLVIDGIERPSEN